MSKCILIFDDDPQILLVCKIILQKHSYVVQTRVYCDDILKDCNDVRPDVILMDLWIPTIGGEQAVNLIKGYPATRHIPVILFSANTGIDIIAARTNADGALKKPFDIKGLLVTIENAIAGIK